MNNVGLMTCFLDNYGACLQAYALSKTIQSLGYNCQLLQYIEPEGYFKPGLCQFIKNTSIYNGLRCVLSRSYKNSFLCEKIKRKSFVRFRKKYLNISKQIYRSFDELKEANQYYDIFVCGSDQIWNPSFYGGNNKAYFLNFAEKDKRKIAYAPSIGLERIPDAYAKDFVELIRCLDYLSVRESNAVNIIKELSGRDAAHVLDPTLLLDGDKWSDILIKQKERIVPNKYILCYLFGCHDEYDAAIEHLRKITGLSVVMIPFCEKHLHDDYQKIYDAGPLEFLNLIKNAELVITDSFHATVFSILFSKLFFTLPRFKKDQQNSMNSRIYSLLDSVGIRERIIDYSQVSSFEIDNDIDYSAVHSKLANMRGASLKYLKGALEGK